MRVLVACEESQAVCNAFRRKGHEAYSCDLQQCEGGFTGNWQWHIYGDAVEALDAGNFKTMDGKPHYVERWDLIIAHPPCTYLSKAGATWLLNKGGRIKDYKRLREGFKAKCLFEIFLNADCERICVENPVPLKIFQLPECTQKIQPWQFGEPYIKKTLLWLKGLEPLKPTNIVEPTTLWCGVTSKKSNLKYDLAKNRSGKMRAKTFKGIAEAMADQWG